MPWNPEVYNQFKSIRYQPFFDLMEFVSAVGVRTGVDIGCGTGALIPYIERLSEGEQALFVSDFRARIDKSFKRFPAMYAFKRMLLYGRMEP